MSLISLLAIALTSQSGDISRYLQNDLHDAAFQAKVVHADQRELAKINSDFGASYRFGTTDIHLKEPFKLRIDARVEDTHLTYVLNGTLQVLKVGPINQRTNLAHAPGRRQTDFDFGLLTPSLFGDLYEARFIRNDRETGDPVFDLFYIPSLGDKTRNRIWIDPAHHVIAKREWYAQDGHLLATFYYTNPEQQNGVWLPTQLEVRNVDNVVAGVTRYGSIKVNEGVSDSLFNVR
jgi:outer membrane lipoprotein-sorting protein